MRLVCPKATLTHCLKVEYPGRDTGLINMPKLCSSSIGCVKGVDEENAYSWPACDVCGNGKLSSVEDGMGRCVCV